MNHSRTLRVPAVTVAIALAALMVAACGSSNTGSASSSSSSSAAASAGAGGANSAARSKLAACLKAHGVTLPARPAGARQRPSGGNGAYGGGAPGFFGGGGAGGGAGAPGARFDNPKFRAALQACGGRRFPERQATLNKAAVTKFAACVTQHGYNLPAPNFSGKGPIFPAAIQRNKKFQAAAKMCAADLRPQGAGAGAPGGAPPASGSSSD